MGSLVIFPAFGLGLGRSRRWQAIIWISLLAILSLLVDTPTLRVDHALLLKATVSKLFGVTLWYWIGRAVRRYRRRVRETS